MLKSLAAVIGLSFIGLGALFLLSADKTVSYDSLARSRLVVPFPKEKILIYGATTYFGSPLFDEELISRRCSEETAKFCHYTNDKNRSTEADAWLYHNRDFTPRLMENRTFDQIHVMFTQESPVHETIQFKPDTVNWTMTYRRDSEVFWPYGVFEMKMFTTKMNNDTIWNMKDKNLSASWMVSNCRTLNKRMELAQKARRLGLDLDIYGGCKLSKKVPGCARYADKRDDCAAVVLRKYYFYLAFENSNCADYVTEKFYNAMRLFYAIPIVIKREIYTNMGFPPKSFIAIDDFKSIQDMVTFLNGLKENKTKYLSYHDWRNDYEVLSDNDSTEVGICALCRRLRAPILQSKSYPNLKKWFSPSACDNSYAFKYL